MSVCGLRWAQRQLCKNDWTRSKCCLRGRLASKPNQPCIGCGARDATVLRRTCAGPSTPDDLLHSSAGALRTVRLPSKRLPSPSRGYVHCVSKNDTDVAYYNYDIHQRILIIFGRYVTKKIGNSKLFYFSTSPNLCFYTTWWNRKPRNCIFLLKCCILFCQQTHKRD